MSATASTVALLLTLLASASSAAAAGEGFCPRPPAAISILRPLAAACSAADSPELRFHHVGVVEGDDGTLQKAVNLVLKNKEDFVAILFYASWCPFSKICRPDFQKMSTFFPTIAHFSFEESVMKPSLLSRYGVRAFPTLFLLNSTMRVRYHGSRTINSLVAFYKDVTGINPISLDELSPERMGGLANTAENDKKREQENCPFSWARSPDRLLQQDTYLALASSFLLSRFLYFLLPKLNACVKPAWRVRLDELRGLFPGLY